MIIGHVFLQQLKTRYSTLKVETGTQASSLWSCGGVRLFTAPVAVARIYRTLFTGSVSSILSLPLNVFSTENITSDILQGCAVVSLTLIAFIGLVWLREQGWGNSQEKNSLENWIETYLEIRF